MGKLHKNLDDFFDELEKDGSSGLKDAFKKHDTFNKDENLDHYYNKIFTPGIDEMYKGFTGALDKAFGKDDAKVYGKKKDLKKAAIEGMKKFFEKVHPSILEAIKEIKDEDKIYDKLASMYNEHVGANQQNGRAIQALVDSYARNRKASVGTLKRDFHGRKAELTQGGIEYITSKHQERHIDHYRPHKVAAHVKKEIEARKGYKVNMEDFGELPIDRLIEVRDGIKKGRYARGTDLGNYGITYEESKAS